DEVFSGVQPWAQNHNVSLGESGVVENPAFGNQNRQTGDGTCLAVRVPATLKLSKMQTIFGIHAVEEALSARGRGFEYVAVAPGRGDARIQNLVRLCRASGVPVRSVPRDQLTRLAGTANHQGVVAITAEKRYSELEDLLTQRRG